MKRATLGCVAALLALTTLLAPPALAHTDLLSSTPENGAVLSELPAEVDLIFSEDLLPETVNVSVSDAAGTAVRIAAPTVNGPEVTFPWPGWPPGATGDQWSVNYRVVSQDGHPVSGSITFTAPPPPAPSALATAAPASAPAPAPAPVPAVPAAEPAAGSSLLGPIIAIAVGLAVGVGLGVAFVRRSRRRA